MIVSTCSNAQSEIAIHSAVIILFMTGPNSFNIVEGSSKNSFSIALVASTAIPVRDLPKKFTSGQINRVLTVTAIGR